jgi:hypothetical protein
MADILTMPTRPRQKGRRREKQIEGAPLADVIDGVDFREASKPTHAELTASINKVAYHLLWASRSLAEMFPAYRD